MKIGEERLYVRLADGSYVGDDLERQVPTRDEAHCFETRSSAWGWVEEADWGGVLDRVDIVRVKRVPSKTLAELRAAAVAYTEADATYARGLEAFYAKYPQLRSATYEVRRSCGEYPDATAWSDAQLRLLRAATVYGGMCAKTSAAIDAIVEVAKQRIKSQVVTADVVAGVEPG